MSIICAIITIIHTYKKEEVIIILIKFFLGIRIKISLVIIYIKYILNNRKQLINNTLGNPVKIAPLKFIGLSSVNINKKILTLKGVRKNNTLTKAGNFFFIIISLFLSLPYGYKLNLVHTVCHYPVQGVFYYV